jgi:hypothetical protein
VEAEEAMEDTEELWEGSKGDWRPKYTKLLLAILGREVKRLVGRREESLETVRGGEN